MPYANLFLSRKQYDKILTDCPALLREIVSLCSSREWGLDGVLYRRIPESLYITARLAIQ